MQFAHTEIKTEMSHYHTQVYPFVGGNRNRGQHTKEYMTWMFSISKHSFVSNKNLTSSSFFPLFTLTLLRLNFPKWNYFYYHHSLNLSPSYPTRHLFTCKIFYTTLNTIFLSVFLFDLFHYLWISVFTIYLSICSLVVIIGHFFNGIFDFGQWILLCNDNSVA